jgi:uncharacterized membrane protein YhaH (DUF805 family)
MDPMFSMRGRCNRLRYFVTMVVINISVFMIVFLFSLTFSPSENYVGILVVASIVSITGMVVSSFRVVQRLHDLDRPGTHYWLQLVPFYNVYMGLMLVFAKGRAGNNRFGPDPLSTSPEGRTIDGNSAVAGAGANGMEGSMAREDDAGWILLVIPMLWLLGTHIVPMIATFMYTLYNKYGMMGSGFEGFGFGSWSRFFGNPENIRPMLNSFFHSINPLGLLIVLVVPVVLGYAAARSKVGASDFCVGGVIKT